MSINSFTSFYNSYPYDFADSSDDETYNTETSMESESLSDSQDIAQISMDSENSREVSADSTKDYADVNDSFSREFENSYEFPENIGFWPCDEHEDYVSDEAFKSMRLNAEIDFTALKSEYSQLFAHPGITEADGQAKYPVMDDIEMDIVVIKSINETSHLMTSGVGPCLLVMARGYCDKTGLYMALSHSSIDFAEGLLTDIRDGLESKGCSRKSIEFYIVGGKLPYREGIEVLDSIDREKEFLALSREFNIVGAQFNLADGLQDVLSVTLSRDNIVWQRHQLPTNGNYLI